MADKNDESNTGIASSKFWRTALVIIAAILIFGGPTYLVFLLRHALSVNDSAAVAAGFAVLVVGVLLLGYLIRKKIIK